MSLRGSLPLQTAPHLHDDTSTVKLMWTVVIALLPAGAWGCWMYGLRALLIIAVSVAAALLGELVANLFARRFTLGDGSAVLSGLLVAFMLPAGVPLYVPITGSLFAMLAVKATFGGLGSNWMNPAVAGQVFVYFAWTAALSAWSIPVLWPAVTASGPAAAVSPLQFLAGRASHAAAASGSFQPLSSLLHTYPTSGAARVVAAWVATNLGMAVDPHYLDLAAGAVPGDIGSVSPILLLIGAIYLFRRRLIDWHAPVGFVVSFFVLTWVFGGLRDDRGWFAGFPLFALLSGGAALTAFFLCSDPVTTPLSSSGLAVFGVGTGLVAVLIGFIIAPDEAPFVAVLLMNLVVPVIDRMTTGRRGRAATSS